MYINGKGRELMPVIAEKSHDDKTILKPYTYPKTRISVCIFPDTEPLN